MEISLRHIIKTYGEKTVITDISLTVAGGSFTTLLGPSGCGKTTLLRMIAGLETPDSGEIYFGEHCMFSAAARRCVPPEKRGLAFVFQDFSLWPHMTVFENVAFGLRASGHTPNISRQVHDALRAVRLDTLSNRYPHQLSGGQQQRVAFARAIVIKPECILFDEPLSALDALLRAEMRLELRELVSTRGITAVFVTHDQAEAMSMSDKIAVFSGGHIEQYDPPEEIYNHPATSFVARFVGSSNWIDDHHMFRPEKACIQPLPAGQAFSVRVVSSLFLGRVYQIHLKYGNADWTYLSPVKIPAGTDFPIYIDKHDVISL
ncbi:ABC transporter ATP-binding protein [Megasphaera cerevisiae DSM 20462]|uniref:ABC-type quaternary amine transporter n=1 Tax=Megasphaera cerevisiae DSM 20462 TaxID=1122219 RepID=A0A0J6WV52_9FIRM|nr:ABC transporter ATP-binding protein [Megasphaera cerevisiae]KMO86439.1 ABC transporter ATP-binding protein [Megasphaera cerevisiae DSM 20462]OKY52322.1 ABC transporter ATP-binding protein [Megasphaera cerevisiae]SJZ73031.1 iron(III) transport system ATP-binding protein [Megasphaera cerevisiae DSM 20462]